MVAVHKARRTGPPRWHPDSIRALRRHLGLTQQQLAQEMGIRQQTVSEWETGLYAPRGASARLLSLVAERAGFAYGAGQPPAEGDAGAGASGDT
ncbi:MAG: helix-turn-helix domain-containing protein [Chloroflexi bacterium]|nr:helix-turn-helix domain-containing protein [Chloroflexota bacterium]